MALPLCPWQAYRHCCYCGVPCSPTAVQSRHHLNAASHPPLEDKANVWCCLCDAMLRIEPCCWLSPLLAVLLTPRGSHASCACMPMNFTTTSHGSATLCSSLAARCLVGPDFEWMDGAGPLLKHQLQRRVCVACLPFSLSPNPNPPLFLAQSKCPRSSICPFSLSLQPAGSMAFPRSIRLLFPQQKRGEDPARSSACCCGLSSLAPFSVLSFAFLPRRRASPIRACAQRTSFPPSCRLALPLNFGAVSLVAHRIQ